MTAMVSGGTEPRPDRIYFCPRANGIQLLGRRDFAAHTRPAIRQLATLKMRWNAVLALYFGLWLGGAYLAVATENLPLRLLCYLVQGLALSTLAVLTHEAAHHLLTRSPKTDRWLGSLCGLPILLGFRAYRRMHLAHHTELRSAGDPDDMENLTANTRWLRLLYVLMLLLGAYLYVVHVPLEVIKRTSGKERRGLLLETGAIWSVVVLAWVLLPTQTMIRGWLFPMMVACQILNTRGIAEHGLTSTGNELIDARTVTTHPVVSFLFCNINYHIEHHLYPNVPWYNLPKVHRLLEAEYFRAGSPVYRSYSTFLWDVAKVLKAGVVPGMRLIPGYIRKRICL